MLIQLILYRLQGHFLVLIRHDIECIPERRVICLPMRHISDITNDAVTIVIRSMDPKHLSRKWSILTRACSRYKVSQMLRPALLGHPFFRLAIELTLNLQTVRPPEPKQLPQAIRVRYIKGAISDGGEGHEQHQDQNYQSSRQSFRQRSAQSTRFQLSVKRSLRGVSRVFLQGSQLGLLKL